MSLLLNNKRFRGYFLVLTSSNIADSIYFIVLMTYASTLTNPALAISIVTLSETLPETFSPITGSLADNIKNKYQSLKILAAVRILFYLIISFLVLKHSMILLYCICLLNFFSDICGKFFRALLVPYIPYILTDGQIEEAQGLLGANFQLISILANFFGALLISFLSYSGVSLINVGIFVITLLLVLSMKDSLKEFERSFDKKTDSIKLSVILSHLFNSVKLLYAEKKFFFLAVQFSFINGILNLLIPIISITFVVHKKMIVASYSFSVALFQGIISLGIIMGGLWLLNYFKKIKLFTLIPIIYLFLFALYLFFLTQNALVIGVAFLAIGLLVGVISPKFSHMTLTAFPREILSTISGSSALLLKIVSIISSLLFSSVSASNHLPDIYTFYLLLVLLGAVFGLLSAFSIYKKKQLN